MTKWKILCQRAMAFGFDYSAQAAMLTFFLYVGGRCGIHISEGAFSLSHITAFAIVSAVYVLATVTLLGATLGMWVFG
jgi:hypothetical protein